MDTPFEQAYKNAQSQRWHEAADALANRPSAVQANLPHEEAYRAIAIFNLRYAVSPLIGNPSGLYTPVSLITPTDFFETAESIDTLLTHGDAPQVRTAATFAVELADILPISAESEQKRTILANVLGIELPSDIPVAQQLVEQRLMPDRPIEEQMGLAAMISVNARTL